MDIVGVGRYVRLPCTDIAEFAFVVEDKEQRNGIGTYLLKELVILAKERAVKTFIAELLNENITMLDILRKFAPDLKQVIDGNSILVTISI
jgi:GNAT superfamily N-acetyltransferase